MQAIINDTIITKSKNTVKIEGNAYFPSEDINTDMLEESDTPYTCPRKGKAQYFNIVVDGQTYEDAAWSYPQPKDSAIDTVGIDFSGYIAFGDKVNVSDQ
jgi:uncharacterized protein (DUF427 family)